MLSSFLPAPVLSCVLTLLGHGFRTVALESRNPSFSSSWNSYATRCSPGASVSLPAVVLEVTVLQVHLEDVSRLGRSLICLEQRQRIFDEETVEEERQHDRRHVPEGVGVDDPQHRREVESLEEGGGSQPNGRQESRPKVGVTCGRSVNVSTVSMG